MKYCIVIADGSADLPLDSLGGKTPLEASNVPNMDTVAAGGTIGTLRTVPPGMTPGSDVAMISVLGYEAKDLYTGRAPLEAANVGIELAEGDWAARANLVTIADGKMADYSAGHISSSESAAVMESLNQTFVDEGVRFYAGKGYRNLLVMRGTGTLNVRTTPPHDISGEAVAGYMPEGPDAAKLTTLMERAAPVLGAHAVNSTRKREGRAPATDIWLWGEGSATRFPAFRDLWGVSAAVITYVDLVAGICRLAGWDRINVPGATGYYDTDYAGKGAAAVEAFDRYDLVFVHVEAPDEASHNGDVDEKIRAIENIDRHVLGPVHEALKSRGDYRLAVLSDHYTLVETGAHGGEPVPFAVCGNGIEASGAAAFDEREAAKGEKLESAPDFMRLFL